MKKLLVVLLIVTVIVVVVTYFFFPSTLNKFKPKSDAELQSFEDCAAAGNLVVDTYPRECHTKSDQVFIEEGNQKAMEDVIKLTIPKPRDVVTNPFEVEGEAIPEWYYNDQLSMKLVDSNQKVLATVNPKAQGEAKNGFVPFIGVFHFAPAETEKGSIIIEKTNPEDKPEIKKGPLIFPVRFK